MCSAVDAKYSDLTIFAEFGGCMCLTLDFFVDFGARGKEATVGKDVFGRLGGKESFPCRLDVEPRSSSCYRTFSLVGSKRDKGMIYER